MLEVDRIKTKFEETTRRFFQPDRIVHIGVGHGGHNTFGTNTWASVVVKGNDPRQYDQPALLNEIDGSVVSASGAKIVIKGKFQRRDCRVTIVCEGSAATSEGPAVDLPIILAETEQ